MPADEVHLPPEALSNWMLNTGAESPARLAKRRLAGAIRALIEAASVLDPERADAAEITAVATAADDATARLTALPRFAAGPAEAGPDDARLLERSGISGASNPLATPMVIRAADDHIEAWAEYGFAYEGPAGCVHGGFVAAAFDDLLGSAQTLSGAAGFTGTLSVRMIKPTPLNRRIDYDAHVESIEGRKILVKASSRCDGELVAQAEGLFIVPRARELDEHMRRSAAPFRPAGEGARD